MNPHTRLTLGLILIAFALVVAVYQLRRIARVYFDRAEPDQWGFGVVSWPVEDARIERETVYCFWRWHLVVETIRA